MKPQLTGQIRNKTVNCDYIVCSKNADFTEVKVNKLNAIEITGNEMNHLKSRLEALEERVVSLISLVEAQQAQDAPYTSGTVVATTLHFDDVDLETIDEEAYIQSLKETMAAAAGVNVEDIQLIDLKPTGSTTARIEIVYKDGTDPAKKAEIAETLNDQTKLSQLFSNLGNVQAEEVQEDLPIQSVNSKLFQLEKMINRQEANFGNSDTLQLKDYRFVVQGDEMRIQRYDYASNSFIGGTLVLDE